MQNALFKIKNIYNKFRYLFHFQRKNPSFHYFYRNAQRKAKLKTFPYYVKMLELHDTVNKLNE